jgi:phage terminase Nu1 subunit (DNA packaging protein)
MQVFSYSGAFFLKAPFLFMGMTITETQPNTQTYKNLAICSAQTGIPETLLAAAQFHPSCPIGTNGFHANGRVYWGRMKDWFEQHRAEIVELAAIPASEHDARFKRARAEREELAARKERGEVVETERVHALMRRISTAQCSLMNSKFRQELPEKLLGKNLPQMIEEIDRMLGEVYSILGREIDQWK